MGKKYFVVGNHLEYSIVLANSESEINHCIWPSISEPFNTLRGARHKAKCWIQGDMNELKDELRKIMSLKKEQMMKDSEDRLSDEE